LCLQMREPSSAKYSVGSGSSVSSASDTSVYATAALDARSPGAVLNNSVAATGEVVCDVLCHVHPCLCLRRRELVRCFVNMSRLVNTISDKCTTHQVRGIKSGIILTHTSTHIQYTHAQRTLHNYRVSPYIAYMESRFAMSLDDKAMLKITFKHVFRTPLAISFIRT